MDAATLDQHPRAGRCEEEGSKIGAKDRAELGDAGAFGRGLDREERGLDGADEAPEDVEAGQT